MRKRLIAAAAAVLAALVVAPAPARAATTHDIQIDGSPLFTRDFAIVGQSWLAVDQVQTVSLQEGLRYRLVTGTSVASFTFWTDTAGNVHYDPAAESYLDGQGTTRLTLAGVDTTIDARYLTGAGVLFAGGHQRNEDWIRYEKVRLLPGSTYRWQQSSGVIAAATAALDAQGRWTYGSQYAGYLGGNGTTTLTFLGYPLIVDARASGGTGLQVQPIWGNTFTSTSVQTLVLLPAKPFHLQVRGGVVSGVSFGLTDDGRITFDAGQPLAVDTFHGLTRLTVTRPIT